MSHETTLGELSRKARERPGDLTVTELRTLNEFKKLRKSDGDTKFVFSTEDLGVLLGITPRTIRRHVKQGMLPAPVRPGRFDIREVFRLLQARLDAAHDRQGVTPDERLTLAKAGLAEIRLEIARGEVISAEDVKQSATALWGKVRELIERIQRHCDRKCTNTVAGLFSEGINEIDTLVQRETVPDRVNTKKRGGKER